MWLNMQFARNHRFGRLGLPKQDESVDTLLTRLTDDLKRLRDEQGLHPDQLVVSGDLAEWGFKKEFDDAFAFLAGLTEFLQLARRRVVIVPGNHDINRDLCEAHFLRCRGNGEEPSPPYWPKWEAFSRSFKEFYGDTVLVQRELESAPIDVTEC